GFDAAETSGVPFVVNNADLLPFISTEIVPPHPGVPLLFSGDSIGHIPARRRLQMPLARLLAPRVLALTLGRELNALRRARGLAPVAVSRRLADRLIMVDSASGLEYARPLPPLVQMVGPMIDPDPAPPTDDLLAWLDDGPPVVLVSLGTLARP